METEVTRPVVIVGGGPAGQAAAAELLRVGQPVTIVDEAPELGGRYYKQYLAAPSMPRTSELDALHAQGEDLAAALRAAGPELRLGTLVWGLFPELQLGLYRDGNAELLSARAVVLATGAIERLAAFPGWTLPGVVTAGGLQTVLSHEAILPGQRVLVAGTGPLLLATALEVAEAGGEVVAVIEGASATAPLRHVHQFLGQRRRLRQAIDYARALRSRNIPVHTGQKVVAARGENAVQEAVVAQINRDWEVVPGNETTYQVDTLCLHYGFVAATELARMAGCQVAYDRALSGWYVEHDDAMRSSQPGIYIAGQLAGIGGVDLATASGRLAGLALARDLGALDEASYQTAAATARQDVERGRDFARVLGTIYTPGPGIADTISADTIVCRCEEVAAREIDTALAEGINSLNDVKRRTRCGMGLCQGRVCSPIVADYLLRQANVTPDAAQLINARPPVRPIPLSALAAFQRDQALKSLS